MHPDKVRREGVQQLTDLPNIGPAAAQDLRRLGIDTPRQLRDRCPLQMYQALCRLDGERHDPCVIDVFISITEYVRGAPARPWWAYTAQRKQWLLDRRDNDAAPMPDGWPRQPI